MKKKDLSLIRKLFTKKTSYINKVVTCICDGEQTITDMHTTNMWSCPEEDADLFLSILKKGISGKQNKNLYDIDLVKEKEDICYSNWTSLTQNFDDSNKDIKEYCQSIINTLTMDSAYALLLAFGSFDIPKRASDGAILEDASDEVYTFVLTCVCPIKLPKRALIITSGEAHASSVINTIEAPVASFLYPSLIDQQTDLHHILYYTKKETEPHEEFAEFISGYGIPLSEKEQQSILNSIVEHTLGRQSSFDNLNEVNSEIERVAQEKTGGELSESDLKYILCKDDPTGEKEQSFAKNFKEIVGKNSLKADSISRGSQVRLESETMKMSMDKESAELLQSRVIDGVEYILIPVGNGMTLNGMNVLVSEKE